MFARVKMWKIKIIVNKKLYGVKKTWNGATSVGKDATGYTIKFTILRFSI